MDYVRDGKIQGQCAFKKTEERPCILDAVTLSGILKAKQKLSLTFNSDKLGDTNFTNIYIK